MGLTKHEKEVLAGIVRREVGGCEHCGEDLPLIPHRIRRGNAGGKYIPRNIMMVCKKCHRKLHCMERMGRK
jgi:hypothetical protein